MEFFTVEDMEISVPISLRSSSPSLLSSRSNLLVVHNRDKCSHAMKKVPFSVFGAMQYYFLKMEEKIKVCMS